MKKPIYLDYNATTPVDPRVFDEMLPTLKEVYGNAASKHFYGWEAEKLVEQARERVAKLIHADSKEIVFTSGATESNNLALKGVFEMYQDKGDHIITQVTEHKCVLDTCRVLERKGAKISYLPVDAEGRINLDELRGLISSRTILVSIMAANNEVGTLQNIETIGKIAREKGVLFHTDAAQAVGKTFIDVNKMNIDLLSLSAHKIYGPKGSGALYARGKDPRAKLIAQINGGGHERGMRSGTLNVPGIVGLGKAAELCVGEFGREISDIYGLRERLRNRLENELPEVTLNGSLEYRLPGNLNLSFGGTQPGALLAELNKKLAVSSGSACTSATPEPSYVLKALGIPDDVAYTSIRFGVGRFTTVEEIEYAADEVIRAVKHLRALSSLKSA